MTLRLLYLLSCQVLRRCFVGKVMWVMERLSGSDGEQVLDGGAAG
jgi:hypothetical protein